jgi:membrane associated rhomboid family serine protease
MSHPPAESAPEETEKRATLWAQARRAPVTAALVAACLVAGAATLVGGPERVFGLFAKDNAAVWGGEAWRLVTACFLHASVLHLALNASALWSCGRELEELTGSRQVLAVFVLGGVAGNVGSLLFTPEPSVGASGAVFALLGATFAAAAVDHGPHRNAIRHALLVSGLGTLALNLGLWLLVGQVDHAGHAGGLLAGLAAGTQLRLSPRGRAALHEHLHAAAALPSTQAGLRWTGQQRRVHLASVLILAAAALMFGPWLEGDQALLAAFAVGLPGFALLLSIRCPRCMLRPFWWSMSAQPVSQGDATLLRAEGCPRCAYPQAQPMPAQAAPGEKSPD